MESKAVFFFFVAQLTLNTLDLECRIPSPFLRLEDLDLGVRNDFEYSKFFSEWNLKMSSLKGISFSRCLFSGEPC